MTLKKFLTYSLIVHLVVGICLYFYYNPIIIHSKTSTKQNKTLNQVKSLSKTLDSKTLDSKTLVLKRKQKNKKVPRSFAKKKKRTKQNSVILKKNLITQNKFKNLKNQHLIKKQDIQQDFKPQTKPDSQQAKNLIILNKLKKALIKEQDIQPDFKPQTKLDSQQANNLIAANKLKKDLIKEQDAQQDLKDSSKKDLLLDQKLDSNVTTKQAQPQKTLIKEQDIQPDFKPQTKLDSQQANSLIAANKLKKDLIKEQDAQQDLKNQHLIKEQDLKNQEKNLITSKSSFKKTFRDFNSLKQRQGNLALSYPYFARADKLQGTVSVQFFVTKDGLVDRIKLIASSGHAKLDNFVLKQLSKYEFFSNQESWVRHSISFKLQGNEIQRMKLRQNE